MSNSQETGQSLPDGTSSDAAGKKDDSNQPDNPQLSPQEQFNLVALVVFAMIASMFIIIAWWPANPTTNKDALYVNKPFHVRPIKQDTNKNKTTDGKLATNPPVTVDPAIASLTKRLAEQKKRSEMLAKDVRPDSVKALDTLKKSIDKGQLNLKALKDKQAASEKVAVAKRAEGTETVSDAKVCTIQMGNLMLILVAAAGFLGNLIHVSRSLTFYIGMKKFQRSWYPWYVIKPFTASGLALLIYFATNSAGSVNIDPGTPINLTAIMLTAGMAGLFTDIATQKLKVIFEAVLKPADTHFGSTDQPSPPPATKTVSVDMTKVSPVTINTKGVNQVKIPGQNLDPKNLVVMINNQVIDKSAIRVTATQISFDYQPKGTDATATEFLLSIKDATANLDAAKKWAAA